MSNTDLDDDKSFVKALRLQIQWVQNVFINIDRNFTALLNQMNTNLMLENTEDTIKISTLI
jgi:hypothetical protein